MTLAEKDSRSPFALEAATWIIFNTSDGPEVEKAAEIILQNHVRSTNLVYLCQELLNPHWVRHRSSVKWLRSIVDKNPDPKVRANACFALAVLLKEQADESGDEPVAEEAGRMFERVIADYSQVESEGKKLADRAVPELSELRRLGVGREASEIAGEDMDGRPMKLSDYRGKVVVLVFWGTWCGPCMAMVPDERKLVERMIGKPFALIGVVNSDEDPAKVKEVVAREKVTWPSFRDGRISGRIATDWKVDGWPTIYLLDRKGVIRYRNVRDQALADAVDAVIREGK